MKAVSRSDGKSATAAAAYRSGSKITDTRTGEEHDYRRKGGIVSSDIVPPPGSPEWATDRAKLWNAAEAAERRKDACVAREYEVALPVELSPAERHRLAIDFSKEMANKENCAVDVSIHEPSKEGDNRNYHAHILRTTRKLTPDGLGDKLDTEKAGRNRKADLEAIRQRWAELVNERLKENGIEATIDHRNLENQGIDREPTQHLGASVTGFERRTGQKSRIREDQEHQQAANDLVPEPTFTPDQVKTIDQVREDAKRKLEQNKKQQEFEDNMRKLNEREMARQERELRLKQEMETRKDKSKDRDHGMSL